MTMALREKPQDMLRTLIIRYNLDGRRSQRAQQEVRRRQANSEFLDVSLVTLERFSKEFFEVGKQTLIAAELSRVDRTNPKLFIHVRKESPFVQTPVENDPFTTGALLAIRLLSFEAQRQGYLLPPIRDAQRNIVRQWMAQPVSDTLASFLDGIEYYCGTESRLGAVTTIALYRAQHAHNLFSRADRKPQLLSLQG